MEPTIPNGPAVMNLPPDIKRVALCVPARNKVDLIFMQSYLALFIHLLKKRGIVAQPIFSDALPLDKARNLIAKNAIVQRADYCLWMDSDIVMTEKMFEKLWTSLHEKDGTPDERFIVSGIYFEREIPYDAVIRRKNEMGYFDKIYEYPEDRVFDVEGVGFGFVLMKIQPVKHAFAHSKGYPFRFSERMSEDLYFCDLMTSGDMKDSSGKPITYKIWVDPDVCVPHHGSYVSKWHFLHYKIDEFSDISELARYLGMKNDDCYKRCCNGALAVCKKWQEIFGKESAGDPAKINNFDLAAFYRTTDLYLYDLTWYYSHNRRGRDEILAKFKEWGRVLDFACGIGDYGLAYAEQYRNARVDFYDVNKPNVDYLKHRIEKREKDDLINKDSCRVYDEHDFIERPEEYDAIYALDFFEHVKEPEAYAARMRKMLKRNGTLFAVISSKQQFQPQHISEINLEEHGFVHIDVNTYVRSDSDLASNLSKVVDGIKSDFVHIPGKKDQSTQEVLGRVG